MSDRSVDEAALRAAAAAACAGRAPSVCAGMTDRARRESLTDVLADIRADPGPATDEETVWGRSVHGL
jgi:hypothetical protein